jgi:signal transduction histidine kinase/PAS domain-containing protein
MALEPLSNRLTAPMQVFIAWLQWFLPQFQWGRRAAATLEGIPNIVWRADARGQIKYHNRRWHRYVQPGLRARTRLTFLDRLHSQDAGPFLETYTACLCSGEMLSAEIRLLRFDGVYRWHLCQAVPHFNRRGHITAWLGSCVDIESLKKSQEVLKQAQQHLRAATTAAEVGTWHLNCETFKVQHDANFNRIIGRAPQDSTGDAQQYLACIDPRDRSRVLQALQSSTESGCAYDEAYQFLRADGKRLFLHSRGQRIEGLEDGAKALVGTIVDQTRERFRTLLEKQICTAETAFNASLDLQQTLEAVVSACCVTLCQQAVIYVATEPLMHSEGAVRAARHRPDGAQADGAAPLEDLASRSLAEGPKIFATLAAPIVSGEPYFSLTAAPQEPAASMALAKLKKDLGLQTGWVVPFAASTKVSGFLCFEWNTAGEPGVGKEDPTWAVDLGRRAAQAVLHAQLYQNSQRSIAARDEFLAVSSHELRSPLVPLRLQVNTLSRLLQPLRLKQLTTQRLQRIATISTRSVERLDALLDHLLDVTRIGSGHLTLKCTTFDLGRLVANVVEDYRAPAQQAGCTLHYETSITFMAHGDCLRIEQVIVNLLTNAIKYAPHQPIDIRLTPGMVHSSPAVCLQVSDHGPGISRSERERIFKRFERIRPVNTISGLGLGLYIARELVEAHGGTLDCHSQEGKGATFKLCLPILS